MVGVTEAISLKRPRLGSKASHSLGAPVPTAGGTPTPDSEDDLKSRSRKATLTSESDSSLRPAHKAASAPLTGMRDDTTEYSKSKLLRAGGVGDVDDSGLISAKTWRATDLTARGNVYLDRIRDENMLPLKKLIEDMKKKYSKSVSCENLFVKSQELGDDFLGEMLRMKLLYSTFNVLLTDTTLRQCSCVEGPEARQVCLLQCYQCFYECDGEAILSCYLMNAQTPDVQRAAVYFASLISKIGEYSTHPQDLSLPDVDTENQSLDSFVQIISSSNSLLSKEVMDGLLDLLIGRKRGLVDEGKEEVFGIFSQVITRPGVWRRISELLDLSDPKTRLYALSSLFLLLKRNPSNRTTLRNLNQWYEWLVPLLKVSKDRASVSKEEMSMTKDAPSEEKSVISTISTRKSSPESGGVKISDDADFIDGMAGEAGVVLDLKISDTDRDDFGDVGYEVVLQIGILAMTLVDSIGSEDGVNTFFDLLQKVIRRIRLRKSESHDILRFLFFSMVKLMKTKLIVPEYWEAEFTSSLAWINVLGLLDLCKDFILYDVTDRPIDVESIWDFRFHTPKNLKLLDQLLCKEILEFMDSKLKQGWEEMELSKTSKSLGKPTLKLLEDLKQRFDFFDRLNYFFEKVDEHENLYGGFALKFRENVVQLGRMIAKLHNVQYKKARSFSRKLSEDLTRRGWEESACKDCTKALLEFAYHIEEKRLKLDVKKRTSEAEQVDLGTISSLLAEKHLLRKKPVHSRSPIPITILTERQMNRDFLENHFKKNLLQLRSRTSTVGAGSGSRRPPKTDVKDSLDE